MRIVHALDEGDRSRLDAINEQVGYVGAQLRSLNAALAPTPAPIRGYLVSFGIGALVACVAIVLLAKAEE